MNADQLVDGGRTDTLNRKVLIRAGVASRIDLLFILSNKLIPKLACYKFPYQELRVDFVKSLHYSDPPTCCNPHLRLVAVYRDGSLTRQTAPAARLLEESEAPLFQTVNNAEDEFDNEEDYM
ncbi:unnamed protein product, partial [Mesorhabditis spiculigera]